MTPETKGNLIAILFIAAIAAIGAYVVLAGFGAFGRSRGDAPDWVIVIAGAAFLLAAGSMGLSAVGGMFFGAKAGRDGSLSEDAPYPLRVLQILMSLGIVALLAIIATWVAFNPGDAGSTGRRVAFAIGAVTIWMMFFGFAIWKLRRLRG